MALVIVEEGDELTYTGPFRIYFNQNLDAPRVWAIDNGTQHTWEFNVTTVTVGDADLDSGYDPDAQWPQPKAWFYGCGYIRVYQDGSALISNKPSPQS